MPRPPLFDRPMTNQELQARHRERTKARTALAQEAVQFVLRLRPDRIPPRALAALQRKLEGWRL